MHDASLDTPYNTALPCAPSAVPGPYIFGQRATALQPPLRPTVAELAAQADHHGVDISREMRDIQRVIDRMKAKVGIPAARPLRIV